MAQAVVPHSDPTRFRKVVALLCRKNFTLSHKTSGSRINTLLVNYTMETKMLSPVFPTNKSIGIIELLRDKLCCFVVEHDKDK